MALVTSSVHKEATMIFSDFISLMLWLGFPLNDCDDKGGLHAASAIRFYHSLLFDPAKKRKRLASVKEASCFPNELVDIVDSYCTETTRFDNAFCGLMPANAFQTVLGSTPQSAVVRMGQGGVMSHQHHGKVDFSDHNYRVLFDMYLRRAHRHLVLTFSNNKSIRHQYLFAYDPVNCFTTYADVGLNDPFALATTADNSDTGNVTLWKNLCVNPAPKHQVLSLLRRLVDRDW